MNFDFSEEQLLLRDQARKFLSERAAPSRVRRILETDAPYDRELWDGLAEMAWPGTAIPEAHGGAGYGYLELCVIAEELGAKPRPHAVLIVGVHGHRSDSARRHRGPEEALAPEAGGRPGDHPAEFSITTIRSPAARAPETKLGDAARAIPRHDPRSAPYRGRTLRIPSVLGGSTLRSSPTRRWTASPAPE
jgi:Acyl-CoA dehydrogenase, N-terminal domain